MAKRSRQAITAIGRTTCAYAPSSRAAVACAISSRFHVKVKTYLPFSSTRSSIAASFWQDDEVAAMRTARHVDRDKHDSGGCTKGWMETAGRILQDSRECSASGHLCQNSGSSSSCRDGC
eukprot:761788-Hanusia_phi.AAC.1